MTKLDEEDRELLEKALLMSGNDPKKLGPAVKTVFRGKGKGRNPGFIYREMTRIGKKWIYERKLVPQAPVVAPTKKPQEIRGAYFHQKQILGGIPLDDR